LPDTEGLAQAKRYASRLQARFAFSTNGERIYQVDMKTGTENYISQYPSPEELWQATFTEGFKYTIGSSSANDNNQYPMEEASGALISSQAFWRLQFSDVPFEDKGGTWEARYYQHNAINQALESIAAGKDRILLTLATGTGKTFIAFQLAWKLFYSRWNVSDWKVSPQSKDSLKRRPRILFLADRNILADQAYNSFSAFPEDALVRIDPEVIRKKGRVPKNGSIFFTIFQTFMSGSDEHGNPAPSFGDYPSDFFDFIIIDECHRGGANDESTWRSILDYFSSAVQLGLTATPKRKGNTDTYAYFNEPVYIYSLKEGINDGFLTPFRVKQIATTIDDYLFTPDDKVIQGEIDPEKRYQENEFNQIIEIMDREQYRVQLFMDKMDQSQKTLVFCAKQEHALAVRNLINQSHQPEKGKTSSDPNYCIRVTANDGSEGERWLRVFQDNEKTIPTILTTSKKLSTGVDARNVRNIVLMRPVTSMIEFKQIVGRGTRLFDNKDYFTIYDFVKAYEHFSDPDWDGEPLPALVEGSCKRCNNHPCTCEKPDPCVECGQVPCICGASPCPECGQLPCICDPEPCPECAERPCICKKKEKIIVQLANGKKRTFDHMIATTFWSPDGKPMSATQFLEDLLGKLPELFKNEDELRALWGNPKTRKDRVKRHKTQIFQQYTDKQQEFLDFVLGHYISQGVTELDAEKLPDLLELKYGSAKDAIPQLGSVPEIRGLFIGFQEHLYAR